MTQNNDIYAIVGRIKNHIAKLDLALSGSGTVLVNYYSLFLKKLYDFSATLPEEHKEALNRIIYYGEDLPSYVISVSTPRVQHKTTLETVTSESNEWTTPYHLLDKYTKEYNELGEKHGMTGDDFWMEAESASSLTEGHCAIMNLSRRIQMCKYFIDKESKDG